MRKHPIVTALAIISLVTIAVIAVSLLVDYLLPRRCSQWIIWGFAVFVVVGSVAAIVAQVASYFRDDTSQTSQNTVNDTITAPSNSSSFIRNAVAALNSPQKTQWEETIDALKSSTDPDAALILKLTSEHHHTRLIRTRAVIALVEQTKYHDISWSAIREAALQQDNQNIRKDAYTILGKMGGHEAVEILATALQEEKYRHLREVIIYNLGFTARSGDPYALQFLSDRYLNITDGQEKHAILNALQYFITDDATELLMGLIPQLKGQSLREAIISLIKIGTSKAEEGITSLLLNTGSQSTQNQIIVWLGETGTPVALKILESVKDDPRTARTQYAIRKAHTQLKDYLERHRNHP